MISCCTRGWYPLAILLYLLFSAISVPASLASELAYESWTGGLADPPHPAQPFFTKGNPVETTVVADGTNGTAIFTYDNNTTENTGGARGSWQFSTYATASGPVTLDYVYAGYHAEKKVYASLEVFILRNGEFLFTPLVEAGPADCCTPPSGGFEYTGATTLEVNAGERYGFRLAGGNSDQESTLRGELTVNIIVPVTANEVADVTRGEDSPEFTVDLANAFNSNAELALTVENIESDNPGLFDSVILEGTDLKLTPAANQNGAAIFTIRATSIFGSTAEVSFTATLTPVNDAPEVALPLEDIELRSAIGDLATAIDLVGYFSDVDLDNEGDTLSYSASSSATGVVNLTLTESLLEIFGIGAGATTVTVTASDAAGASVSQSFAVTVLDDELFGSATLIQAVTDPDSDLAAVALNATGQTGTTTQTIELLTATSCADGELGQDALVFAEIEIGSFDGNGEAFLAGFVQLEQPLSTYVAARVSGTLSGGEVSTCIIAGPDNDSWVRALEIDLAPNGDISSGSATGYLDRAGNARWYKFAVQPGARATVELSGLPRDYDLYLFKDINQIFQALEGDSDVDGLNRLGAEFAPSAFAPSVFADSVFAPSSFAPDAYAPSAFAPSSFAPSVFAPSVFAPSVFAAEAYSPSAFAPSSFAPSSFAPSSFAEANYSPSSFAPSVFAEENYASAQVRALVGVSAKTGTGSERVVADTWNNTGFFYVRVSGKNGAYDLQAPFDVSVTVSGVDCSGVAPILPQQAPGAVAGGYDSIILWDSARVAAAPDNSADDVAQLETNLQALAARGEVNGVIVDLADYSHVQALHAQADANTSCPYAENLNAQAIKAIIDDYRALNPTMAYVVLVGGDSQIPFFRYPDQGLLGPERDYDPPMANDTHAQSALKLNYILGQDAYGAELSLSLRDGSFPLPKLAVGRLVETAADMNTVLAAYLGTSSGVIDTPDSTLVTGYDFLEDTANAIQAELVAGVGGLRNDTLITAANISPDDPRSWTADDLRRELLEEGEDIIFLAGHFSANSALAADFKTSAVTTELVAAETNLTNSLVISGGCHSGYNIVNEEIVPGLTLALDWPQAFARKGATLIAGTGYQYGDTDFIEYGERLYLELVRRLRTGSGPVSVGEALVQAKQHYLATTPDIRGLHRKSLIISAIFGLPMLSVDMPGERIPAPPAAPGITPAPVVGVPGDVLGLQSADIALSFAEGGRDQLTPRTVELTNIEGGTLTATYLEGPDGVVTYPAEPALPLVTRDVTAANMPLSLRGVGFRSGSWDQFPLLPLTGAPTTELRGVHTPFASQVFFPMRLATANYFDALTDGTRTLLHVTPAQHRVENFGDFQAIQRRYESLDFRLYYSDNTQTYGTNRPALSAPPSLSSIAAVTDGDDLIFFASVVVNPAAGVHEVWVTYTDGGDASGDWVSLDLEQDAETSTLWSATLYGAANAFDRLDFVVQAVSGTGLVTMDDNFGAYYQIAGELGEVGLDGRPLNVANTEMTLSPPAVGTYGDSLPLSASLSSNGFPVANASVTFTIGGSGVAGETDSNGNVSVALPLTAVPGDYVVTASFGGDSVYAPSSAEQPVTIEKAATLLNLEIGEQIVGVDGIDANVSAILTDTFGTPLLQRTVYFTLSGASGNTITRPVITDITGRARLGQVLLPQGSYDLTVRFLGNIPTDSGALVLDDPTYIPTETSGTVDLFGSEDCPNETFNPGGGNNAPTLTISGFCYLAYDVRGKAEIRDGTLVVGEGIIVTKKVDQFGEGGVVVLEGGRIRDKVFEEGPGSVIVYGTIDDLVVEQDAGDIIVGEGGSLGNNADESGDGSVEISGTTAGNVKESESGDLTVTATGVVGGNATESGDGTLTNDGLVTGKVTQD